MSTWSGTIQIQFAFPVNGGKWRTKPAKLIYRHGFLDGVEVDGEQIPHSFGPYGMTVSFTYWDAQGEVYRLDYDNGHLLTYTLLAEAAAVVP